MGAPGRRQVHVVAPIRVADLGGWTDTWFAGHGRVTNLAVEPGVEVWVESGARDEDGTVARIRADRLGAELVLGPDRPVPAAHQILAAAIEEAGLPADVTVAVRIASEVPPGASTGTSAAVTVALLAGLDGLTPGRAGPAALAAAAHRVEVERLGLQSGVQDQLASAHGGANHIVIDEYPQARVEPIRVDRAVRRQLDRRLLLVCLGRAHRSSAVHDQVIASLAEHGPAGPALDELRQLAVAGRDALAGGDLAGFGRTMVANSEAQAELHPALVSDEARRVIDVAAEHDAAGWKVNGAGGAGGSITLLAGDGRGVDRLADAVAASDPRLVVLPVRLARRGLRRQATERANVL